MKICLSDQLDDILKGRRIIFDSIEQSTIPIRTTDGFDQFKETPKVIHANEKVTSISAIDSSVLHLARTEEGRLYAAKAGVVISSDRRIRRHFRIGPLLIYLTEEFLCNSKIDNNLGNLLLVDSSIAKRLIRIRLERAIQLVLTSRLNNSIILVDGALSPSVFEDYNCTINRVIEMSTLSSNDIIGLSKSTNIPILNQFENLLKELPYSACLDTSCVIKSLTRNSSGNNLLVKLGKNENEYVLRADICSANGNDLECLGRLIGNDILSHSYPESLRIAHHISTFTTTEVSSLKGFISRNYSTEVVDQAAVRSNILGVSFV
jgi:NurA domain-containing protein